MAKWKLITILALMFLIPIVASVPTYEMCEDTVEIDTNCTMITPTLSCTNYVHNITNASSGSIIVKDGNMDVLNGSVYYFNFTQPEGKYLVTLCDGTTREVHVKTEVNKMALLATLILLPVIIGGLMFYVSSKLKGKQHWAMNIGLMLLGFVMLTISWAMGIVIVAKYLNFPELQNILGTNLFGYGMFFWVVIIYFLIYTFIILLKLARNKKKVGNYEGEGTS